MRRRIVFAAFGLFVFGLVAGTLPAHADSDIVVFAAASLKDALNAVNERWHAETGRQATISYAASSTLAKQIESGAPADVFISADRDWMKYLDDKKLIAPGSQTDLLANALVLIAPADSKAAVTIAPGFPLAKALDGGKLAMADPAAVPAGKYGKAALTKLGVWGSVEKSVAAAENVRAALALVARGEAPFGIVYQTDAAAEPKVKAVAVFPPDSYPPIVYPVGLVAGRSNPVAAAFAAYLRNPSARKLFEQQGFVVLAKGS